MSPTPADQCAFCKIKGKNSQTGELQRTPDGKIVAHYNCMLYSPRVTSKDSQEDIEGFDFKIDSVQKEIKRGKNLYCTFCNKPGATVGCDVESCRRTYHYPCVEKAKGSPSSKQNDYVVYCFEHKDENNSGNPEELKNNVPQISSLDSRSKKASRKRHHLACTECDTPLPDGSKHCNNCRPSNPSDSPSSSRDLIWVKELIQSSMKQLKDEVKNFLDEQVHGFSSSPRTPKNRLRIMDETQSSSSEDEKSKADNYPLEPENQEDADDSVTEKKLVCQESSKSKTSKRKLSRNFEEPLPDINLQQTKGNVSEVQEISEEQDESNFRENIMQGSVESEWASELHSEPPRTTTPRKRRLYTRHHSSKRRLGFQHLNSVYGFECLVGDQCRHMSRDRQNKYIQYVLGSADLFCASETLPPIDILLANLRTVLEGSQQSSPCSARSSSA